MPDTFDLLIWVGNEALFLWDRKRGELDPLIYPVSPEPIPGLPKHCLLWEDGKAQTDALRRRAGVPSPGGGCCWRSPTTPPGWSAGRWRTLFAWPASSATGKRA